uniref:Uncharacterized protein n=1 Tax=Aegilops tauschii TaxID=37682 RepID=M8CF33_AEGTA
MGASGDSFSVIIVLPVGLLSIRNAGEELRGGHEVLPGEQVSVGDSNVRHTTTSSARNNTKLSSSLMAPATQADLIGRPGGFHWPWKSYLADLMGLSAASKLRQIAA